jgi:hypothetical protein
MIKLARLAVLCASLGQLSFGDEELQDEEAHQATVSHSDEALPEDEVLGQYPIVSRLEWIEHPLDRTGDFFRGLRMWGQISSVEDDDLRSIRSYIYIPLTLQTLHNWESLGLCSSDLWRNASLPASNDLVYPGYPFDVIYGLPRVHNWDTPISSFSLLNATEILENIAAFERWAPIASGTLVVRADIMQDFLDNRWGINIPLIERITATPIFTPPPLEFDFAPFDTTPLDAFVAGRIAQLVDESCWGRFKRAWARGWNCIKRACCCGIPEEDYSTLHEALLEDNLTI